MRSPPRAGRATCTFGVAMSDTSRVLLQRDRTTGTSTMGESIIPERITSDCQVCGGRIYAQRTVIFERYTGGWLHLHGKDWHDNPHEAIPTDTALALLMATLERQNDGSIPDG